MRDHQVEFRKMKKNIREQWQSADLMNSVRKDIDDYNEGAGVRALNRERNAIENSTKEVDIIMRCTHDMLRKAARH